MGGMLMMKRKKVKPFPFSILLLIHIVLLIVTFEKNKNKKPILILLLTNIGFAYIFEFFVFNLLHSYKYRPQILKSRYLDNVLGAFLSQGVYLPITSVFISAFGYGWKWKLGITIFYAMIERIFISLKVFHNKWWSTYFTLILIPFYFLISDFWLKNLKKGNELVLFISYVMLSWVTGVSVQNVSAVIRNKKFGMGRVYNWREHFILAPIYWFILSLFSALSQKYSNNWLGKLNSFLFMKLLDWLLAKKNIVKSNKNDFMFHQLIQIFMIYVVGKYKDIVYKETL
jgi:hypothetical protein